MHVETRSSECADIIFEHSLQETESPLKKVKYNLTRGHDIKHNQSSTVTLLLSPANISVIYVFLS